MKGETEPLQTAEKASRSAELNPFRRSRIEQLEYLPRPQSLQEIYDAWRSEGFRGQVLGPRGSGKTTLARGLLREAETEGLDCLCLFANADSPSAEFRRWERALRQADPQTVVLADGISHAFVLRRRRWIHRIPRLLVTAHRPLPALPIMAQLQSDPALLKQLVARLAGDLGLRLLGGDGGALLLRQCQGNLHQALRRLYFRWSDRRLSLDDLA